MQPASITVNAGNINVMAMSCKAVGITPITFHWEKYHLLNNSWIRPSHRAMNITSPYLEFAIITEEDEGDYHCVVTSDDGSVTSDTAAIFVYGEYSIA